MARSDLGKPGRERKVRCTSAATKEHVEHCPVRIQWICRTTNGPIFENQICTYDHVA
jgi:hypothetical protein